eukprot:Gb_40142 [translate_table: standard]
MRVVGRVARRPHIPSSCPGRVNASRAAHAGHRMGRALLPPSGHSAFSKHFSLQCEKQTQTQAVNFLSALPERLVHVNLEDCSQLLLRIPTMLKAYEKKLFGCTRLAKLSDLKSLECELR